MTFPPRPRLRIVRSLRDKAYFEQYTRETVAWELSYGYLSHEELRRYVDKANVPDGATRELRELVDRHEERFGGERAVVYDPATGEIVDADPSLVTIRTERQLAFYQRDGAGVIVIDDATDPDEAGPKAHRPDCRNVSARNFRRKALTRPVTGHYWWAADLDAAREFLGARPARCCHS